MIVRGTRKERFKFYLVRKPPKELFSKKDVVKAIKKLFKALFSLFDFSLLSSKEKSLYNITFTKTLKLRGGSIGKVLR